VDAGSQFIGVSVTTGEKEVFAAEAVLRTDITELLSSRSEMRRARRSRKTRWRKARFNNRRRPEGWLPPSVRWKVEAHKRLIARICKILPVNKIIVETAQFDIQKIKDPTISGIDYQCGDQLGYQNVKEYVRARDGHKCQTCGKSKIELHVHHIESRQTGGDAPNNLVTLCVECHENVHNGSLDLSKKRGQSFRDTTAMTIMRPTLLKELRQIYPNVQETFGYITKYHRQQAGLEKSHVNDARCIEGKIPVTLVKPYLIKFVRANNRQLHKCKIPKGGKRKANKAPKYLFGFMLFDKVEYQGQRCFIFGRRSSGSFDIRLLDGTKLSAGVSYKKLRLLQRATTILIGRPHLTEGVS